MKAEIENYDKGLSDSEHTYYRLFLTPENDKERGVLEGLNQKYVVWVSPNIRDKDGSVSWWGKK